MSISQWFKGFGKNTTSNVELQKYCKRLKIDVVIRMRDKLLSLPKDTKNVVMDLEDGSENGSHWVCVFNDKAAKYYFDSYGLPPPIEVVKF